jgi:hypothetical protein
MPRAQDKVEAEIRVVRFTQAKVREKIRKLRAAAAADPDHIGPGVPTTGSRERDSGRPKTNL